MTLPDPSTYHPGELDLLFGELAEAGFRPVDGDRHAWRGPIPTSLRSLTDATQIKIEIRDGWPYRHPYVHVDGLAGRKHVNGLGNVCLWPEDDDGYNDSRRLGGILERVDAWVAAQEAGVAEPALDAHLYTGRWRERLVTIDIEGLIDRGHMREVPGESGHLRASLDNGVYTLGEGGQLAAAWFWLDPIAAPPSVAARVPELLDARQKQTLQLMTSRIRKGKTGVAVIIWEDAGHLNALAVEVVRTRTGPAYATLELARTDRSILRLRSGPDAPSLATRGVVVFGLGAIGSEVAMLLARSGVGRLTLIDHDRLRPSNLIRHAASARTVGMRKSRAMAATIAEARLDTAVVAIEEETWRSDEIAALADGSDLLVDASGNRSYRDLVSRIAADRATPLLAVALHRGGRIARVRVQATDASPLWNRSEASGFPEVPAEPDTPLAIVWETGCGAPVNNAPPASVASAGALATRMAVGLLAGRDARNRDVVEVYEPIPDVPFNVRGLVTFEPVD